MQFEIRTFTLADYINLFDESKVTIDPPYQRNFVWSEKSQQLLIESILSGTPIPSFFLLLKKDDNYELVDGQQRTRTILAFHRGLLKTSEGTLISDIDASKFHDFKIPVTIITELDASERIESFYALVNSTGIHTNRPELKKAEYFYTNFLGLVNSCLEYAPFKELDLFTDVSLKRMNDMDFTTELLALSHFGTSDKKEKTEDLFEQDIDDATKTALYNKFTSVIDVIARLNKIHKIKQTRYKQRNDFYTLFDFVMRHSDWKASTFEYLYRTLVLIGPSIKPSQEECPVLMQYARHCVTQSNSKNARDERYRILSRILVSEAPTPNSEQSQILRFLDVKSTEMIALENFHTMDNEAMSQAIG